MKTKKYAIGLYANELTRKEALEALKKTKDLGTIIFDACMRDVSPDVKFSFDTFEDASNAMNHSLEMRDYGHYIRISGVFIEEYLEYEDGEYAEGGNFEPAFEITQDHIDTFNGFIGKEVI